MRQVFRRFLSDLKPKARIKIQTEGSAMPEPALGLTTLSLSWLKSRGQFQFLSLGRLHYLI